MALKNDLEDALDTVDARLFTGDPKNDELTEIEEHIDRFKRRIIELKLFNDTYDAEEATGKSSPKPG